MNKRVKSFSKVYMTLFLALTLLFGVTTTAQAKTFYSYNNIGLNYKSKMYGYMEFYGAGKNGYDRVLITSVNGNSISYSSFEYKYDSQTDHYSAVKKNKTYTKKMTSATKFYNPASWNRISKVKAYNYKYSSVKFKKLKMLEKVSKTKFFEQYGMCYIKVKNGKVKGIVHPVILADI